MQTIEITLDESLMAEVNRVSTNLRMTKSDFMKVALERALQQRDTIALELQDAEGYARRPEQTEETGEWLPEQDWEET
jgi:metal-responsive CopG/Arc/MetJ family transcriptional regulator